MYKTIVESIGLYGAELCEVNKRHKSRFRYGRRCCKRTRLDRIKNVDIRAKMRIVVDIVDTVGEKMLNWDEHLK